MLCGELGHRNNFPRERVEKKFFGELQNRIFPAQKPKFTYAVQNGNLYLFSGSEL